jgi:Mg2+ and Co2+ transporter CorA
LPGLPYREWGVSLWWVVGGYVTLLILALAGWQRRKQRLMKLQTGPPDAAPGSTW